MSKNRIELATQILEDMFSEYVDMLIKQGKTKEEIIECLERYGEVREVDINE